MCRTLNSTFNAGTRFALDYRDSHPQEWADAVCNQIPDVLEQLEDALKTSEAILSEKFKAKGITVGEPIIKIALIQELIKRMTGIMECNAGMMLANGITKTNIARALSMRPQNLLARYPDIENLADAQDKANETGEPQEVHLAKTNTVQVMTKRHA